MRTIAPRLASPLLLIFALGPAACGDPDTTTTGADTDASTTEGTDSDATDTTGSSTDTQETTMGTTIDVTTVDPDLPVETTEDETTEGETTDPTTDPGVIQCDDGKPSAGELCFLIEQMALLPGAPVGAVALADLDDDATLDAIVGHAGGINLYFGSGDGGFANGPQVSLPSSVYALAVGDLDGDGVDDVASALALVNTVFVHLGDGAGSLIEHASVMTGELPRALAITHVDDDLTPDVVSVNDGSGDLSLLVNDGLGGLAPFDVIGVGTSPTDIARGRFSGAATDDLVVANFGGDSLSFLPAAIVGFGDEVGIAGLDAPRALAAGDLNDDLALDLVVSSSNSTVHMAGALGIPAWAMIHRGPPVTPYWIAGAATSPW